MFGFAMGAMGGFRSFQSYAPKRSSFSFSSKCFWRRWASENSPEVHGEGLCEFFVDGLWKTWIYRFRLVENYLEAKWSLVLKVNPKTRPGLNSNQTRVTWVPGIDMVFIFTRPFPNEGHVFLISTWPWKGQLQQDLRDGHKLIGHRAALMKGFTWKKLETKSSNKL